MVIKFLWFSVGNKILWQLLLTVLDNLEGCLACRRWVLQITPLKEGRTAAGSRQVSISQCWLSHSRFYACLNLRIPQAAIWTSTFKMPITLSYFLLLRTFFFDTVWPRLQLTNRNRNLRKAVSSFGPKIRLFYHIASGYFRI